MKKLNPLSDLIAKIGSPGAFATRSTASPDDLNLTVEGVGRIRLPVSPETAYKLCEVAQPAQYGFKDQTLLDTRVRDTWEIPVDRISIDSAAWRRTLDPQLDQIRRDLGLPQASRLRAELHNLLIYAPGQFFATHQDSEKTETMVASLVVSLPSQFTGGDMIIKHHEEQLIVRGSRQKLSFAAFYADCHHEVRPIKQGYRIALTYNLSLEGGGATAAAPREHSDALASMVRRFFETPCAPRWPGDDRREPPNRLVYLLDHQYTERGLAWQRLKNGDLLRAATLRDVAEKLDCEIVLALADVHETWNCEYDEYSGYDYDNDGDEDEYDGAPSVIPEPTDLIESQIELRHWIGPDGQTQIVSSRVDDGELCYTKPSSEMEPFESEHEGYMGNYGNTVEHWYHRAAVVMWPRERGFVIRAKASASWAVDMIARTLKAGEREQARQMTQSMLPFWPASVSRESETHFIGVVLMLAAELDDAPTAAALLQPFYLTAMSTEVAPQLARLQDRYGPAWLRDQLEQWWLQSQNSTHSALHAWIDEALPEICRALCAKNLGPAQWLLEALWLEMRQQIEAARTQIAARLKPEKLTTLAAPLLSLITTRQITNRNKPQNPIVEFLISSEFDALQTRVLHLAHERYQGEALRRLNLKPLHAACTLDLETKLHSPTRAKDNWSIDTLLSCACELCAKFSAFLRAPDRVRLEWPLATPSRAHIHNSIDARDLPVTHETLRRGRPYTLILEKTPALFERERIQRLAWQKDLTWLTETVLDF